SVHALGAGGGRLLATAGGNGEEFFVDRGGADWTISFLDNVGLHPGLQGATTLFTGTGWLVGSDLGVFRSALGQSPWTRSDPGFGPLRWVAFARKGGPLFAGFDLAVVLGAVLAQGDDGGATLHAAEFFDGVFIHDLGISGNNLYAARGDGLWRSSLATLSVPPDVPHTGLAFAVSGPQPFRDVARVRFQLA